MRMPMTMSLGIFMVASFTVDAFRELLCDIISTLLRFTRGYQPVTAVNPTTLGSLAIADGAVFSPCKTAWK